MPPMSVGWPNCVVCIHRVRAVSRSQPVVCHVRDLEETCCYACTQWLVSPGWSYSVGMKFVVPNCPFCNRPAHLDDPDHLQKIVPPHRSVLHQLNKGRLSIRPFCNRPANLDDPDHLQEKHTHGPVPEQAVHFKSLERLILSTGT